MSDLQILYNAKSTLENYWSSEKFNRSCENEAADLKTKAKKDIAAKCKSTFSQIQKKSDQIVFKDGGFFIVLILVALVVMVVIAPFTFAKSMLNFSFEDYVAECAEQV